MKLNVAESVRKRNFEALRFFYQFWYFGCMYTFIKNFLLSKYKKRYNIFEIKSNIHMSYLETVKDN